ncbi:NADPH-dependent 2,4-dienoyl-CoA reductase/sulfur reductase-like enzyme [Salsuginibacillus halophilus]|uniref:NADPH-dependent 2,4-dienoyl-CoA reductase/sulfur reductase-like enzyme n=1 Tax=Salsuginibacillus halophilus TaxID=517424 RepID=A0A2P8HHX0_9BACI|nr:FAD-dependent oxidoreductase [Salsuginibacillus halophilus]PSL45799.1 NADPH-dependent 2,4-dienoyl-CoA reductase/sulfur reductase-like enzyme [Salsuginibacillus halophilus]
MTKYVIIGGEAAGMSAAMQIVRNDSDAEITTLEAGGIYSYAQCGLPYVIGGAVEKTDHLIARDVETFRDRYGIDARTYHTVTNVDAKAKEVHGTCGDEQTPFTVSYDRLLIASGVRPRIPNWPGTELTGVHKVKTIPDIHEITDDLSGVTDAAVIGGGYVGLEMAENLREIGVNVHMIERNNRLAKMFDEDMSAHIHEEAKAHGIGLRLNEQVESLTDDGSGRVQSVQTNQGEVPAQLVIVATGAVPNTEFLEGTGVTMTDRGAVRVNAYMETNVDGIYAAGDCATQYHRIKEKDDHIPLGTHANKQGRIAGLNMIGSPATFKGIVGTAILRFHNLTLARTGLSEAEARQLNFPFETVVNKSTDIAGYFEDSHPLHVKLVYHSGNGMLLGGQVIGEKGADKRIDVLATALFHRMDIDDLKDLDLAYAPPFNGVWDPIQQTARRRK